MAQGVVHAGETRASAALSARAAALIKSTRAPIRRVLAALTVCESLKHTSCGPIHVVPRAVTMS